MVMSLKEEGKEPGRCRHEADHCQDNPKDGSLPRDHVGDGASISGRARWSAVKPSPSHDHERRDQGYEDGSVGLKRGQIANPGPPNAERQEDERPSTTGRGPMAASAAAAIEDLTLMSMCKSFQSNNGYANVESGLESRVKHYLEMA